MISGKLNLIALTLAASLSVVCGQVREKQRTLEFVKQTPQPFHLPLFEKQKSNDQAADSLTNDGQNAKRAQFFKHLLENLDDHRMNDGNSFLPISDHLILTLQDSAFNTVILELTPNTLTAEKAEAWSHIVEHLANHLAHVVHEAEQQGYNAQFKYSISLSDIQDFAFGTRLSPMALKSAAG